MNARPTISVANALQDSRLFGPFFVGESWDVWRSVLKAAFAEKLSPTEIQTFRSVAGRDPPKHRVKELACAVGRGGGKDSTASFIAAYIAMSFDAKAAKLRPGEKAHVLCLAVDREQAAIQFNYICAYFSEVPVLKALVKTIGTDSIELRNRVVIQVTTNSFRSVRGRSILCTIFDEVAFWRDEKSANPDVELHAAITPGLARVRNSMLILISSVHRRNGLLFDRWKSFYGKDDDDVLVVLGSTTQFNPTFDRKVIDKALALDPQRYGAEYESRWRDDLAQFVSRELVDALIVPGRTVLPRTDGVGYVAFCDPSGGSSDSMTLAISHMEGDRAILDLVVERRPPFSPDDVTKEFAATIRSYGIATVRGDRYGGLWPRERFAVHGIDYQTAPQAKSDIYLTLLPLLNSARVELLDNTRLTSQLCSLERRSVRGGRDTVDHPPQSHDDIANAAAGAIVSAVAQTTQQVSVNAAPIFFGKDGSCTSPQLDGPQRSTTQRYYDWLNGNGGGGSDWWGIV
jgi:hypothetical protein